MQHSRGRVDREGAIGLNLGSSPSSLRVPGDAEHVVGEGAAEDEGRGFGNRLWLGRDLGFEAGGL